MASASEEPRRVVSRLQTRGSMADIMQLHTKLYLQEMGLRDLLQRTTESGQNSKEKVKKLFSEIKDMLYRKELEICGSIDAKTSEVTQTIEQCLQKTEVNIEFSLSVDQRNDSQRSEFLDDAVNNMNTCLQQGDMLMARDIVAFKVDAFAKSKVENFKFGEFTDASGSCRTDIDVDTCSGNSMVGMSDIRVTGDSAVATGSLASAGHQTTGIETAVEATATGRGLSGTQEFRDSSTSSALPSAPALTDLTLNYEDPPPTYWQAVGLTDPSCESTETVGLTDPSSESTEAVGLTDPSSESTEEPLPSPTCDPMTHYPEDVYNYPEGTDVEPSAPPQSWIEFLQELQDNSEGTDISSRQWVLQRHRAFHICSPDNLRKPIPVALCSHNGIVCVADKSNSCIGFFTESGAFLEDAVFKSPVYDVQFFQDDGAAICFVATFPKEDGIKLLYFKDRVLRERTTVIRPRPGHQYTSVCKGPTGVPFFGASTQRRPHLVMTFDFENCQTEFLNGGDNFLFPRSCLSYGSNVIVSDWNLGLVCVFQKYGRSLGRYTGTQQYPLTNPTDMTMDPNGNIYIVSGRLSTIHVIDQECNFLYAFKVPGSEHDKPKLIEYLVNSQRLAVVRESGKKMDLFNFEEVSNFGLERSGSVRSYGWPHDTPLWL